MLFKDIRDYQILFLTLFLILGIGARDWTLQPQLILVAIVTCISIQWLLSSIVNHLSIVRDKEQTISLRSAVITSLGLSLLLRADHWTTMAFAAASAIASKFVFKVDGKHFFNPANFGIISALALTPDAWVSPGQWGKTGGMGCYLLEPEA